jgi:hypothetical protein
LGRNLFFFIDRKKNSSARFGKVRLTFGNVKGFRHHWISGARKISSSLVSLFAGLVTGLASSDKWLMIARSEKLPQEISYIVFGRID